MSDDADPVQQQADRALKEALKAEDGPLEIDLHLDRTKESKTPGFSRMVVTHDWNSDDARVVQQVMGIVQAQMVKNFWGAYQIMNDIFDIVRDPECNPQTGEIRRDTFGFPVWARTETGAYIEDFSRLGIKERNDLLYRVTISLFEWEQTAAEAWGEAMFSKAQWEEAFAEGFKEPTGRVTVDDRTQHGRRNSVDYRYHAIFRSLYSRRADALVRSLSLLGQRLKDTM